MPGAPDPAVELRGASKRFGWTWALRPLDLRVEPGETVVLVGANGAGKSTLLKLLATLYRPTRGEGTVMGWNLTGEPDEIRRRTVLLAGRDYLYDELTGRENLRFAARMAGVASDLGLHESVLEQVDLADAAERRVRTYSTGMRKRLALARTLVLPGELFLLDEPYAGLDRNGQHFVDGMIRDRRAAGDTLLVATHQAGEAVREADRVIRLERGRVVDDRRGGWDGSLEPRPGGSRDPGAPETGEAPGAPEEEASAARPETAGPLPQTTVAPPEPPGALRRAAAILWKDLLVEARTKQAFSATVFFAVLVLVLFAFGVGPDPERLQGLAGGLLWVGIVFTGTLSLSRTYQSEELAGGLEGLRSYAGDPRAIYLGKLAGNLLILSAVELILFPAAGILYHLELWPVAPEVAGLALLGTFGFSVLGTFYAGLAVHLRARELMLPLLVLPALVPVLVGAVEATTLVLTGDPLGNLGNWIRLLAAFDVIFFVLCTWIFPILLEE